MSYLEQVVLVEIKASVGERLTIPLKPLHVIRKPQIVNDDTDTSVSLLNQVSDHLVCAAVVVASDVGNSVTEVIADNNER